MIFLAPLVDSARGLASLKRLRPQNLAKPRRILQLPVIAQPHKARPQHPRVQLQRGAHNIVCFGAAIKTHDKVVAAGVADLVSGQRRGQAEDAPVGNGADDAAVSQNLLAAGEDNVADFLKVTRAGLQQHC